MGSTSPQPAATYPQNPIKDPDTCTILVTGFGPFQSHYPINPSHAISQLLPPALPPTPTSPSPVTLITHAPPIRVAYAEVSALVPALLESYRDVADVVLHIGMASGRAYYAIERQAHRDGYEGSPPDVDGVKLPKGFNVERFPGGGETLSTSLPFEEVLERWQGNVRTSTSAPGYGDGDAEGGVGVKKPLDVRGSEDAGRYLCDFIYYQSLAWSARQHLQSSRGGGGRGGEAPVLFLHVPPESDEASLARGVEAAVGLCRAVAESLRRARNGKVGGGI